jgi:ferritin-like protein
MPEVVTLDLVDKDGAIREALDGNLSGTRAEMFKKAIVGGGAFAAGGLLIGGLPSIALGAPSAKQDVKILNFALLLEYLESSFYVEAARRGNFSGELGRFTRVVRDHELAHVSFLKKALGSKAIAKPTFDFGSTTSNERMFRATAQALEDTGVSAYNGQGPRLTKPTLAAAAMIVSVEARHAAWIRRLNNGPSYSGGAKEYPAPAAFDKARTMKQVVAIVNSTGFVK